MKPMLFIQMKDLLYVHVEEGGGGRKAVAIELMPPCLLVWLDLQASRLANAER